MDGSDHDEDRGVYDFDQNDIVKGSGYITSQCCGSTEIELGTVYVVEMGISLFSEIDRYTLEDGGSYWARTRPLSAGTVG